MINNTVTTLLFDLFHTLSSIKHSNTHGRDTSDILGIDKEVWNTVMLQQSDDRLVGRIKDPFRIIKAATDTLGLKIPDSLIQEAALSRQNRFRQSLHNISKNTHDTIRELKKRGFKLGLISNADAMEIAAWHQASIAPYFDTALFSCNVGYSKPDPRIFEMALEKLEVPANRCAFIGDGGSDELITARKMGMMTILTTEMIQDLWPRRIPELLPQADLHIENIRDLLDLEMFHTLQAPTDPQ